MHTRIHDARLLRCGAGLALSLLLGACSSSSDGGDAAIFGDPVEGNAGASVPEVTGGDAAMPVDMAPVDVATADPDAATDPEAEADPELAPSTVDPPAPTIDRGSYEAMLREIVPLLNREDLDRRYLEVRALAATLSAAGSDGTIESSGLGLSRLPVDGTEGRYEQRYSCDAGGELALDVYGGVPVYRIDADDCVTATGRYSGGFAHNSVGREGGASEFDGFSASLGDDERFSLNGKRSTSNDRVGYRRSFGWVAASLSDRQGDDSLDLEAFDFSLQRRDGSELGQNLQEVDLPGGGVALIKERDNDATLAATFSASAPWSGGVALHVLAELNYDAGTWVWTGSEESRPGYPPSDLPQPVTARYGLSSREIRIEPEATDLQWQAGSVRVTAPDGSSMTLRPLADDPSRFEVDVGGETFAHEWNNGFRIRCSLSSGEGTGC